MPWSSWSVQLPPLLSVKVERSGARLGLPLRWTWDCVGTHSWFGFRRIKSWLWFCLLFHQGIAKFVVSWIFWQPRLKCFSTLLSSWMKGAFCKKARQVLLSFKIAKKFYSAMAVWKTTPAEMVLNCWECESTVRCGFPSAVRTLFYAPPSKAHPLLKFHYSVTFILAQNTKFPRICL